MRSVRVLNGVTTLDVPGAKSTGVLAINRGHDSTGRWTMPIPSTLSWERPTAGISHSIRQRPQARRPPTSTRMASSPATTNRRTA